MTFELLILAVLGVIVGSFLNVFILRLNTGRSNSGRSGCMSCGAQLTWKELIPLFSYAAQSGRCRSCGSSISHQYWMVELSTAVLFVLVGIQHVGLFEGATLLFVVSLLVIIAAYDFRHTIIPNKIVYIFLAVTFATNIPLWGTFGFSELATHFFFVLVSGAIVAFPLFILWAVSSGRWMGFGDVKLVIGFGFALGAYQGLMAVLLGFIVGAVIGLLLLSIPKVMKYTPLRPLATRFTMSSEVPFAPFLIAGFFLVLFFNIDVFMLTELFYGFIV
ncbi:prepilin peptidase [Candidatus Kaiserbacteria bacterium]|nr:MAG: prepilin peptidase [Candidatus Kaiserbacteria bacterium]